MSNKLIEVALPLEAVNAACRADKDRKSGTIRNLHKWFAPMPGPAWRALLYAAIVDAPEDEGELGDHLDLIRRLVASGSDAPPAEVRDEAIARIRQCTEGDPPPVYDPFCGGGSTLVEAQKFGLGPIGSDLNPIPILLTRMLTFYPQSIQNRPPVAAPEARSVWHGMDGFEADVRHLAAEVRTRAWSRLRHLYPKSSNGAPFAWLWARAVTCTNPACDLEVPLLSSLWLSKKKGERAWVEPTVRTNGVELAITESETGEPPPPLKLRRGAAFRCIGCGTETTDEHVRSAGVAGALRLWLYAVATKASGRRSFLPPDADQLAAADQESPVDAPSAELTGKAAVSVPLYGLTTHADLYTPRQLQALGVFCDEVSTVFDWLIECGADRTYSEAVATFLGICIGKLAMASSTMVRWRIRSGPPKAEPAFGRHDLPMTWDFAETNPFGGSVGDWDQIVDTALSALQHVAVGATPALVFQHDARSAADGLPTAALIATDPPYFDNIHYADLSDYFYVWIRRALRNVDPELFSTLVTPKTQELIASPSRYGNDSDAAKAAFIDGFTQTFASLRKAAAPGYPLIIVYAFKQQTVTRNGRKATGWEAMLEALLSAGLSLVGSWPIHGTGSARMVGRDSNVLATYVVMVCRPISDDAPVTTVREFRVDLRSSLVDSVSRLQAAAVAPVDLAQAAIGPGMSVYSQYSRVLEADGTAMTVGKALTTINEVLDEILASQESDFDPDTRWAITWFSEHGYNEAPFGAADALATAKNISVQWLEAAGIVVAARGRVRLLSRDELEDDWDPLTDTRLTVWEVCQHLTRSLERHGEESAAELLGQVGGLGAAARELAYRLFSVADNKNWTNEAQAINGLVAAWPELERLRDQPAPPAEQETLL